jgi:hypothetical protein
MSTEFFNDQWRIPSNENQNKVSNYSMDFDGTSDFVTISNPTELTDDFTIAAWTTRVNDSYEMIYTQGTTLASVSPYFAVKDTRLHVYLTGTYETGLNFITANEWQHVALTRTNGVLNLYRNGIEYNGTRPTQNGTINNNSAGIIGKWDSNTHYFQGKIDQVCIFDYALPATGTNSVATLYGGGTAITNPMTLSPIAYYQLGDQSVDNGANYLVPNNSLSDYVFNFINPSDGINVPSSNVFNFGTGDFTISMWFKINSFPSFPYLFDFRPTSAPSTASPGLYISFTKQVNLFGGGTIIPGSAGKILATNIWYNLVVKRTGNTFTTHYDGGSADRTGTNNVDFNTDLELHIGSRFDNVNGFDGEISNFQVFNSALPQTGSNSIETIYNNGSPLTSMSGFTSLVAWYKLNAADTFNSSTSTWTINDYGSGGNDGTSSGMTSANLVTSTLQHTSGFSPYALSLDGVDNTIDGNRTIQSNLDFSVSAWVNPISYSVAILGTRGLASASTSNGFTMLINSTGNLRGRIFTETSNNFQVQTGSIIPLNSWSHVAMTYDSSSKTLKTYVNGNEAGSVVGVDPSVTSASNLIIGRAAVGLISYDYFGGEVSNVSIFAAELSSTEIIEIYNSGVPSNLNNLSGTKPTSWWQLGSNSSFNTNWTCLDEIGTNNAVSVNMTNDDIVNGVGYSANGLGTSSIGIVGDAPYSTANGLSENMDVLDRSTDIPS